MGIKIMDLTGWQGDIMQEMEYHLANAMRHYRKPDGSPDLELMGHMGASFLAGARVSLIAEGKPVDVADTMADPLVQLIPALIAYVVRRPLG